MSLMTSFDAIDKVYLHLKDTPFTEALTGGLYKLTRPVNAADDFKEDAVINSLGMPGQQVQRGIINLNIHVPNMGGLEVGNRQDSSQPDYVRAQQLTTLAIQEVTEFYTDDYWFVFQQQNMVESDEQEMVINIRIEFYSNNF
jgi:hypothetical protein